MFIMENKQFSVCGNYNGLSIQQFISKRRSGSEQLESSTNCSDGIETITKR